MPRGIPTLGAVVEAEHQQAELLGEIKAKGPAVTAWSHEDAAGVAHQIEVESGPPPWELDNVPVPSDARNFVDVPDNWVLYWINPRLLDARGWDGWQPVMASDPRVRVRVPSMRTVENNIRRGGPGGDILAYMPRHWYESRKRQQAQRTDNQTQSSIEKLEQLKQDMRRGAFGGGVEMSLEGKHPTHTIADPAEMKARQD